MLVVDIDLQLRPVATDRSGARSFDGSGHLPEVGMLSTERAVTRLFHTMRCDERLFQVFYGGPSDDSVSSGASAERIGACDDDEMKSKFVAVIPALETVNKRVAMPASFDDVVEGLRIHSMTAFYGHYCRACHLPTSVENHVFATTEALDIIQNAKAVGLSPPKDSPSSSDACDGGDLAVCSRSATLLLPFDHWLKESVLSDSSLWPYRALYLPKYEPYVIMSKKGSARYPRFDERFVGRGYDKMSFFYEMYAQERNFVVLSPGPVLVHHGRGDEPIRNITAEYTKKQRENTQVWEAFILRMKRKYAQRSPAGSAAGIRASGAGEELRHEPNLDESVFVWPGSLASCPADDLPCCLSVYRPEDQLDAALVQKMQDALSWCCTQIDCYPLHTYRRHPDHIAFHMDWAFTRYLRKMLHFHSSLSSPSLLAALLQNRTFLTEHCSFEGVGSVWFPSQLALQQYGTHAHYSMKESSTAAPAAWVGPQLECFVPVLISSNRSVDLSWKALEWLCREELIGNCEGAVRELLLTHATVRDENETDLFFRSRMLFTLYFQVSWHAEDDGLPSSCSFEGVARLRDPTNPQVRVLSPKQYASTVQFQWPMSLASCPFDGLPCCRSRYRQLPVFTTVEEEQALQRRQEQALSWACEQIDCFPLHTYRRYPANLSFHMDWAFSRYMRKVLGSVIDAAISDAEFQTAAAEACHFDGLGELWVPSEAVVAEMLTTLSAPPDPDPDASAHFPLGGGHDARGTNTSSNTMLLLGPRLECDVGAQDENTHAAVAAESVIQRVCDEGLLGDCEAFVQQMQRTRVVPFRQDESPERFRARLLLNLYLQLYWASASDLHQLCGGDKIVPGDTTNCVKLLKITEKSGVA